MTTLADVTGYRNVEIGINRTYLSELQFVTERIAGYTPVRQRDTLLRAFPEIVLPRVTAMQDFAATWADDLYSERAVRVDPPRLVLPDDDALEATVRWAVAPAFAQAAGTVFSNLAGAGQRYIADGGRVAVGETAPRRSVAQTFLRRFPDDDACDWCLLTACVIAPVFEGDPI
jgi:hypothetical protein